MTQLSRRQFLSRAGMAAGGSSLGSLLALGLRPETLEVATLPLDWKIERTDVVPSVCPYCAVGCGQLMHVRDGKLINIEGNPDSPISRGNLCPKGAASFQLTVNPNRQTGCLYRRPGGKEWEPIEGYRVLEAKSGDEAVRMLQRAAQRIDGVLTDLAMPGLGGRQLGETISRCWPRVRVIYMSGFPAKRMVDDGALDPNAQFVQKPFTAEQLTRKVREVLGQPTQQ